MQARSANSLLISPSAASVRPSRDPYFDGLREAPPAPLAAEDDAPLEGAIVLADALPDASEQDAATWLAYARACLGQVHPAVKVTQAPLARTEIFAADAATRDELRECVADAWADWCLGARADDDRI